VSRYGSDSVAGQLVSALKYSYALDCAEHMRALIDLFAEQHAELFSDVDVIAPIPLHKRRQAQRGFNQAQILAKICGDIFGIPVENMGERIVATMQQAKQTKAVRWSQMSNAFVCESDVVCGRHVLVVDDVYTSGATMQSFATELSKRGARRVSGFVFARG